MENDVTAQIAAAQIPGELKIALTSYLQAFEELKPSLPNHVQQRFTYWLEQLVKESTDPTVETHWWETMLDLIGTQIEPLGAASQAMLEAEKLLSPQLMSYLGPYTNVSLREITEDTVVTVCRLSDTLIEPQKFMVAPNAISLAQALFSKKAWYRAIYAGKMLVGFIMLYDNEQEAEYFLWRFMISRPCQGRGYGAQAIQRLVEYVQTRPNAKELGVSCGVGPGSPQEFYEQVGFVSTGEFEEAELVLKLSLGG